jgi:hypothetical protein
LDIPLDFESGKVGDTKLILLAVIMLISFGLVYFRISELRTL